VLFFSSRGIPGAGRGEIPFRMWYGNLGELRSLVPDEVKMIVATASATKETKAIIYESLKLTKSTAVVCKSPDRPNLQYCFQYIYKDVPLELLFHDIIENVRCVGKHAARTIIYCQTRRQCAVLYRVFETSLQHNFYKDGISNCKGRLVEMYHAGTPKTVKRHISKNMSKSEGHIRVLISTIAFGMGIDCKQVNKIIHFGPSKNIECYVQESGRAGRDGTVGECILLYNGLLSTHCSRDMKELLHDENACRRELLLKPFGFIPVPVNHKHTCCDNCAKTCNCGTARCLFSLGLTIPKTTNEVPQQTRNVSCDQKKLLKSKLVAFRKNLIKEKTQNMHNTVTLPTVLLEFGSIQILGILKNCEKIFTISDVLQYAEVWREHHACGILSAISDVFGDIANIPVLVEEPEFDELIGDMDWEEIHNDSTLMSMVDSQDEDIFMDGTQNESHGASLNTSSFFLKLASVNNS
jgi:ATP-dependent DNA helicase RecQ